MANQTVPDLKELFKQAAEIASHVPESMQVAAFNRAVDLLTGTGERVPDSRNAKPRSETPSRRARQKPSAPPRSGSDEVDSLIDKIDSTQHPGVRTAPKVLDRALMVLQIALSKHGVDGLSPGEIARILTDKFRLNTSDAAVRMRLGGATNLVNRIPRGTGFVYRIMGPGEEYLAHLGEGGASAPKAAPVKLRKRSKRTTTAPPSAEVRGKLPAKSKANPRAKGSAIALGPKSAILSLVGAGFFDAGKTGPQVQDYLRTKRGFAIDTNALRVAMLRLVRDGVLERGENGDGHYEYTKP